MNDISRSMLIEVQAQADHLAALVRAKPITALSEVIWNALDADASRVDVSIKESPLGGIEKIVISDDGEGLAYTEAQTAFGNLGGSWKRPGGRTRQQGRSLHGRDGKGRFRAFSLGSKVQWEVHTHNDLGRLDRYLIIGKRDNLKAFEVGPIVVPTRKHSGTVVTIEGISEPLGIFSDVGGAFEQLCEHFAFYLREYPSAQVFYRNVQIEPSIVQKGIKTFDIRNFEIRPGETINAKLDIVEWSFSKKERKIALCDSRGFMLQEIEAGVRPGADYNFTAYLCSDYIENLSQGNLLLLQEMNEGLRKLADHARSLMRGYFRERKAESAADLVRQWKEEGIYPFQGDPIDAVDKAQREIFNICAINVHDQLDSFKQGVSKDRAFTLRMLKTALAENPEAMKRILSEVLDLSREKQKDLADLLEHTTLSAIIEATKLVSDRLNFLAGFEEIVFEKSAKKRLKERTQLHKILEQETWIFGEKFTLSNSDENLTTVLKKHLGILRPKGKSKKIKPVKLDDGSEGVIDMLLAREIPHHHQGRREFLVVELKRPKQPIDMDVKAQIEKYAMAVVKDERFDFRNCFWTFVAVSNDITEEAAETITQTDKPIGFFLEKDHYRVGLMTWSEIILKCRTRLEVFSEKLKYTATKDRGLELIHAKYSKYLPDIDNSAFGEAKPS